MDVTTAVTLIGQIIYRPGWKFSAEDARNRPDGHRSIHIARDGIDLIPEAWDTFGYYHGQ